MSRFVNDSFAYGKFAVFFNAMIVALALFVTTSTAKGQDSIRIVAIGDSLTAGYGLPPGEAFPVQLQEALRQKSLNVTVENAGVSGDTSTGGLQRLDWALAGGADFVILELGANDALRGIEPEVTRQNLSAIIEKLQARNLPVLLTGMKAPPNMGPEYGAEFDSLFPALADKYDIPLYPFFLDGVAADLSLNQEDGIHPNREGVSIIVEKILPFVVSFLQNERNTQLSKQ
ncbi:arylesterase [Sneathiella chinensis]|uniref:Arylesterase n=1 Tax=Sneathiella chinensis TaxID=349750 RepID=A0ABQ5U734_9PROT|nr:arylesterase [Sneathiella chinensis]GLQ07965.1 arylesterase [Sneathiella chinensis]